jgi:hypothetical protein
MMMKNLATCGFQCLFLYTKHSILFLKYPLFKPPVWSTATTEKERRKEIAVSTYPDTSYE